jgi:subtilase family serine protease
MPRRRRKQVSQLQALETRCLLSVSMSITPDYAAMPDRSGGQTQIKSSNPITGYTPSQIADAYGFNQITENGAGTTIAIVDAFNDPKIASDLKTFDANFGLAAPPTFVQVTQTGGSTSTLTTDAGWSLETALDVEWAHAMAPGANIELVEANSDSVTDLIAAVNEARNNPNVSIVSMSWGGAEFAGQQAYDSYFTTPTGHIPETFIAASGDSGQYGGVQWPASSANVLAVGGSTLQTSNSAGAYGSESGWAGSSGGLSQVVGEPGYQTSSIGQTAGGARAVPDVAFNANPNSGFAVYDSVSSGGVAGWQEVGGTSAGAPQWAALIAIANQQRLAAKQETLNGITELLPAIYASYSAPGSAGYASYTGLFHDVTGNGATTGYDTLTGLGTPNAPAIVKSLVTASPVVYAPAAPRTFVTPHWHSFRFVEVATTGDTTPVVVQNLQTDAFIGAALVTYTNTGQVLDSGKLAVADAALPAKVEAAAASSSARHYDAAVWTALIGTATADVAAQTSQAILNIETAAVSTAHSARLVSVKIADAIGSVIGAPAAEVVAETHVLLQLANLDAGMFVDSMRAFAHESAALEATTVGGGWSRTFAVTAAAILSDTILVGYWYFGRARRKARAAEVEGGALLATAK